MEINDPYNKKQPKIINYSDIFHYGIDNQEVTLEIKKNKRASISYYTFTLKTRTEMKRKKRSKSLVESHK